MAGQADRFADKAGDLNDAVSRRNSRNNVPEFELGMGDDSDSFGGSFGNFGNDEDSGDAMSGFGGGNDPFSGSNDPFGGPGGGFGGGGDPFGGGADPFGGGGFGGGGSFGNMGTFGAPAPQQQQQGQHTIGDLATKAAEAAGKGSLEFVKTLGASTKTNTTQDWAKIGRYQFMIGVAFFIISLLMGLAGLLFGTGGPALSMFIASVFTISSGLIMLVTAVDRVKKRGGVPQSAPLVETDPIQQDSFGDFGVDSFGGTSDFGGFGETSDPAFQFDEEEEGEAEEWTPAEVEVVEVEPVDQDELFETANASLEDAPVGMETRAYLFEKLMQVLPNMTPNYSQMNKKDESSQAFAGVEDLMLKAATQVGLKSDNLPELLELSENVFLVNLICTRPLGARGKGQMIADELASVYSRDDSGRITQQGVFATCDEFGDKISINIFTGTAGLQIALRDVYNQDDVKPFVLDASNKMPVVIGVNETGSAWFIDFKNINSVIVSGLPRSGKSWMILAILAQMAAFNSAREVQFLILDAKKGFSSFQHVKLPHIIGLYTDHAEILSKLRWVIEVEGVRRGKILEEAGVANVTDFRKVRPNEEMPYLYVVIDEMMSLSKSMTADDKRQFHGYLSALISQLPALGIRAFLIPHRIVNDVIPKDAYALVECRIAVKASGDDLKSALEVTPRDFPWELSNVGDMGIRITGIAAGRPVYSRGPALMDSDLSNNRLFDFLGSLWSRLDPDFHASSTLTRGSAPGAGVIDRIISGADEIDIWSNNE